MFGLYETMMQQGFKRELKIYMMRVDVVSYIVLVAACCHKGKQIKLFGININSNRY